MTSHSLLSTSARMNAPTARAERAAWTALILAIGNTTVVAVLALSTLGDPTPRVGSTTISVGPRSDPGLVEQRRGEIAAGAAAIPGGNLFLDPGYRDQRRGEQSGR